MGFLYGQRECLFVTELINEYFTKQNILRVFEWLSFTWQFASISY